MKPKKLNRGFMLAAAVFLITIGAVFASVIGFRAASSNEAGGQVLHHTQALYLAQTGIERWIRQRALNSTFTGEANIAFGNGTFTTTTDTVNNCNGTALGANRVSVRSVGNVNATGASNTVCVEIDLLRLGSAMMVYAEETSAGVPIFRRWNHATNSWGARQTANDVGPIIRYIVLKFAHTRNEAILGTMNSNGEIHVQVWNGTAWGAIRLLATPGAANSQYRGFDIEYELQNDRAIVVFNDNTRNPAYQIWNGTAWSASVSLSSAANLNANYSSSNNVPRWVELAANPLGSSNEIALLTLDAGTQVYGVRWNGAAWSRMSAATIWDANASINTKKALDVAYEQLSGRAMFIWGDNVADQNLYRTWDGTTLSGNNVLTIPAMGGLSDWVRLTPRPNSNQVMFGVQDAGQDLNTALWDGVSAFTVHAEHDGSTESNTSMNFDFVFETHPTRAGRGWLMWGNGTAVSYREWTGTTWNPNPPAAPSALTGSDDTSFIPMAAHPSSGTVFAALYERQGSGGVDDLFEIHQVGGSGAWTTEVSLWGGPTVAEPVHFRVDIDSERYTPVVNWRELLP